uniref:Uncharacterized protein n=1 Tax=uncultured Desulfobacterium sp. TaxID=201089 RepID=E1Y7Z6_9BACT|nr:unknown protein [uncultured Desulfobacterium sp.]
MEHTKEKGKIMVADFFVKNAANLFATEPELFFMISGLQRKIF